MKKGLSIFIFLIVNYPLSIIHCYAQQDPQYSMYMFNQMALNPAYAGSKEVLSSALLYRNQWTGISSSPSTAMFSLQAPLKNKKIGLGLEILSDKLGPQSTSGLLLSYAYRIPFSKGKLSFGLRMGMYDYTYSNIDYKDQNDSYALKTGSSKITGTGDFGLYYYSRTFYWGLGMTHLNKGKITDISVSDPSTSSRQAVHFFMPVGKAFEVGNVIINPTLLLKGAGGAPSQMDVSLNILLKEHLWLGISLRSRYGVVFMTQYMINDRMKVGYSYDYGKNMIGTIGKGSHEIMIGYDINIHGSKMIMPRYL